MSFKNLFISDDGDDKKPEVKKESPKTMPSSMPQSFAPLTQMPTEMPKEVLDTNTYESSALQEMVKSVSETYQNGFDSLNKPGYDFYEYYQSIKSVNSSTQDAYKMAFTLGKSMNPNITPDSLVVDAQFYISEIQKVYEKFESSGRVKASEIEGQKSAAKAGLKGNIEKIQAEIARLQSELETNTAQLNSVDSQYEDVSTEINLKLKANTIAKDNIVSSLQEVSNNIKNYLK